MPKQKSHKGLSKRIKITATAKVAAEPVILRIPIARTVND